MERLLPALAGLPPVYLVGGAVRDLLLGQPVVDVDLAVEGDGPRTARELAARLDGDVSPHERFGTATVRAGTLAFDIAATRSETYPEPGALPVTEPAGLGEDLGRRDFAINAMAAALQGDELGHLHDPHGGSADLDARVVRVLHDRSFIDDPTRLLRAVRYEVRLDFKMDEPTEELAREAARRKALATVSGPRIRDELLDLLARARRPARGRAAHGARAARDARRRPERRPGPGRVRQARRGRDKRGPCAERARRARQPRARRSVGRVARAASGRARRRPARRAQGARAREDGARGHARLRNPRPPALRASRRRSHLRSRTARRAARSCATWPTSRACGSRSPARTWSMRASRSRARSDTRSRRHCARSSTASWRAATRSCATRWRWPDRRADPAEPARRRGRRSRPAGAGSARARTSR